MRIRLAPALGALTVLTAAALAAGACGGDGGGSGGGDGGRGGASLAEQCPVVALAGAEQPVEITFWHAIFTEQNLAVLRDLVDRFHASQDAVRVRLVQQPGLAEALTKYRAGLSSGDLPDLVQLGDIALQTVVDSASTVPVQACVDADRYALDDYVPRAIDYYTTEGVLRAMPWTVGDPVLYYDRARFRAAGLDPDRPPRTLDDVREYSRRIVDAGAAEYGVALRSEGYYLEYWFAKAGELFADHANGREGRAERTFLDGETGRALFGWWKDMVDSGLALDTGAQPGGFDHLLAVGSGRAAMTFEAAAGLGPICAVLESGQYAGVELGVGPLPGPDARGGLPVGDSALWIPEAASPAARAAAWSFVKFLNEPAQQATLHAGAGYVPIRRSVVDEPEVRRLWRRDPQYRVAYDQLVTGPRDAATSGAVIGPFQEVRDAVRDAITAMLRDDLAPEDAAARARSDADAAIGAYNARVP